MTNGADGPELAFKIGKLVEEKGWNQEDFARIANLNRHTVRQILNGGPKRRLRNATVSQCSEAFGLTVSELRTLPLDRLLARVHGKRAADEQSLKQLYDQAALPDSSQWLDRNKEPRRRLPQRRNLRTPGPAGTRRPARAPRHRTIRGADGTPSGRARSGPAHRRNGIFRVRRDHDRSDRGKGGEGQEVALRFTTGIAEV